MTKATLDVKALWNDERMRSVLLIGAALVLAITFAFWDAFANFARRWGTEEELSHSPFLPLVTLFIFYERREALMKSLGAPNMIGLAVIAGALLFGFLGAAAHVTLAEQLAFVIVLGALPLALGGVSMWRVMVLPLAYLLFIVPPPAMLITLTTQQFQLMSSELGVWFIRLFGIPVELSGNVIYLANNTLEVVEACAGLNYLFPFLSLGALAAYFYQGPLWQRALIFLSTIPITIFMNGFRVGMTGILMEGVGGNHADGFVHFFEGIVVFILCIFMLFGVIYLFTICRGQKDALAFVGFGEIDPVLPTGQWSLKAFIRNGVIATVAITLAGVLSHTAGNREQIIPERYTFDTLPLEFPEWRFRAQTLADGVVQTLGADDYIVTDMVGPEGQSANLYIAYLEARRDNKSWHSPLQCLPGGGWEVLGRERRAATTLDGTPFVLNRMIIRQQETELLVHFWYDQRGRKVANEFAMRGWVVWDDLTRRRSDGAMIRLMTPISADETEEDAAERLTDLRLMLEPTLERYIPH